MPLWSLNKKTNTAEIYGGVAAILKHEGIKKSYKNKLYRVFSRKKEMIFEDEKYRIEKKEIITTKSKTK